jgi:alpha-L-arabinofuranosidase
MIRKTTFLLLAFLALFSVTAQNKLTVQVNKPTADIQPTMWGIFFEDINLAADGGIYAELVKNRSFEFTKPLMGWKVQQKNFVEGAVQVVNRPEKEDTNPRYLQVLLQKSSGHDLGLTNEGFRGMGVKKDITYTFSVLYRQTSPTGKLNIELVNAQNEVLGSTSLTPEVADNQWHKQAVSFKSNATDPKAKLNIWFEGDGKIDLDMISLFPSDTWKNRLGGLRADLVQLLADLKPGFIRFPGGCIVEGFDLAQRYQWKKTVGAVEDRHLIINRWNTEFSNRSTPDYFQSFGLGFFEYFQLAEDIGAEPLPILNCGMACQFNSAELVPTGQIDPYVQDALDLIEFANGSTDTKWGKLRAEMGHPAPFNLKMMGVGNENWGPQYVERLKIFTKAIKDQYPGFKLVNSSGTDPSGDRFDYLNGELRKMNADLIDEHYYRSPEWFLSNARRYDNYPRTGSKVFAGEYASHCDNSFVGAARNNWKAALSEAAFMTGLERNAAVVSMASYAPLFAHLEGWQWAPDLIWYDNLHSYGTPSYYVQKLYSNNKGNKVVPINLGKDVVAGQDSIYASAVIDTKTKELIVKIVNASGNKAVKEIQLDGVTKLAKTGTLTVMQSGDMKQVNSIENPVALAPKMQPFAPKGKIIKAELPPYSFAVYRIKLL